MVIHRGLNAETYFTIADANQSQNLIDGLLYASPPATERHEEAVLAVAEALAAYAREYGGKVYVARDCWLGEATVVQPDVAYLAPERDFLAGRYLRGAPDLVVEVISPGSRTFDTEMKFAAYAATDVREIWFVDPDAETTTVLRRDRDGWDRQPPTVFGEVLPTFAAWRIGAAGLAASDGGS
jgi:Uma2 family endonuclease